MIWYNKNKTRRIDLSKIVAYSYSTPASRMISANPGTSGFIGSNINNLSNVLELILGGGAMKIEGPEAEEIYQAVKKLDSEN